MNQQIFSTQHIHIYITCSSSLSISAAVSPPNTLSKHKQVTPGCVYKFSATVLNTFLPRCSQLSCLLLSAWGPTLHRVEPSWQRPTTYWEMTLQNSCHSQGEGRGWLELFLPKVKHGNDYMHCWWCWVVSLSLWLKWAHNVVCLPVDRFQMLMAGSWCEGASGGLFILAGGEALHAHWKSCTGTNLGHRGKSFCAEMYWKHWRDSTNSIPWILWCNKWSVLNSIS